MQVINAVGSKYTVQNLITYKNDDVHISRLKPFEYDPADVDPRVIAMQDEGEFLIDYIKQHRGDPTKRSTLEFLVKWAPGGGDDSWEPWENLRRTDQLFDYLQKIV